MTYAAWSPAPQRGIVPLHPLSFGTILGKSFAMLRHNPAVLLGFGILTQFGIALLTIGLFALIMVPSITRAETVSVGSSDYDAIMAGMGALAILGSIVIGFLSVVASAAVQGVVAANLRSAVLGERPRFGEVWRHVQPVFGRLIGYTILASLAVSVALAAIIGIALAIGFGLYPALDGGAVALAIIFGILMLLVFAAAVIWLGTKLLLVPSVFVFERLGILAAMKRSWSLTNGRFWATFGVSALIGMIVSFASGAVSTAAQLFGTLFLSVLMPTGGAASSAPTSATVLAVIIVALVPQLLTIVISAVGIIAQQSGIGLIYVDARMRREGLDQRLLWYTEHRAAGWDGSQLGDPYEVPRFQAPASQ